MILVLACCAAAYIFLQVRTLIRLRRKMRIAAICCALAMTALAGVSLTGMMQGSNLAPVLLVFSIPAAIAYLVALLLIDAYLWRRRTRP
jgi:hypothetical protein